MSPESELQNGRRSFVKLAGRSSLFFPWARGASPRPWPPLPPESSLPLREIGTIISTPALAYVLSSTAAASTPISPPRWSFPRCARPRKRPPTSSSTYMSCARVGGCQRRVGAEYGIVTCGSAGSISAAVAGCITGSDPKNIYQLPDTTGIKAEVIIMGGRSAWDSCIRLTGARLIVAPTVNDLNSAITSQTAMIYTAWQDDDRINQILKISKPAGVPSWSTGRRHPPVLQLHALRQARRRPLLFQRRQGLMGPQVSGLLLRPQGPH